MSHSPAHRTNSTQLPEARDRVGLVERWDQEVRFAAAEQLTPKFKATLARWSGDVEIGFPSVGKTPPSSLTLLAGPASPNQAL